jgi:hypothetical protein
MARSIDFVSWLSTLDAEKYSTLFGLEEVCGYSGFAVDDTP